MIHMQLPMSNSHEVQKRFEQQQLEVIRLEKAAVDLASLHLRVDAVCKWKDQK